MSPPIPITLAKVCHSLRGVWIEIIMLEQSCMLVMSHSLRGVWIEIGYPDANNHAIDGHSLRGVWIEMLEQNYRSTQSILVTPFGECGLKLADGLRIYWGSDVTPFGECGLKYGNHTFYTEKEGHSLRGVWIEIDGRILGKTLPESLPSGSVD